MPSKKTLLKLPDGKRRLVERLGYSFKDLSLVETALSHRSVGAHNNERLEFLGDSIVNFIIGEALFQQFPQCQEGELSQMRAQMVKGVTLAEIAREFEIGDQLNLGQGELKSGGFRRESILADAVEALIGAMYLDGGMDICRENVLRWYRTRLEKISPKGANKDAKSKLQEWLQSTKKALPVYSVVQASGDDHEQSFEIECMITHLQRSFTAVGSSRRAAEQAAAAKALDQLQKT